MSRLSLNKTRGLFIGFFLALVIPAGILSHKANEQLKWQSIHQLQLDAQSLAQQIDNMLAEAIEKEEARNDTDYTFFVFAGTPEARFVQRSELSKYPVESDIAGVIGYFQIDEKGTFSSPILPSSHVQSAVQPQLYGISVEENIMRNKLEKSVFDILSQNQLVDTRDKSKLPKNTQPKSVSSLYEKTNEKHLNPRLNTMSIEKQVYESEQDNQLKKAEVFSDESQLKKELTSGTDNIVITDSRMTNKADKANTKSLFSEKSSINIANSRKESSSMSRLQSDFQDSRKKNKLEKRKARLEKNYSPQQTLVVEEKLSKQVSQDEIQIKLFESEIEPFRFSLLESGHFVLYRQVWRNNKRLIQGAILSSQDFLDFTIQKVFNLSSLVKTTGLNVYFSNNLVGSFYGYINKNLSTYQHTLPLDILQTVSLSEPFSDFSLEFNIRKTPVNAGTTFINAVAGSLLLILILGCYFLYRLAIKQSNLVEQQQDFVSSVSHELKTPLTSIRMYGEILKQGWVSDEKREEYYDYIYSESERLSRLIANVLQISKVNHNALDLNLVSVEISELVSLINSKVDSQIKQSNFLLDISVDPKLSNSAVLVDSDAFVQIIINLVDNAIKYADKAAKKQIDIKFILVKQDRITVSIRDYGPGIGKKHLKHVFDLFYRSESELTRETAGTGIGLALVKELVDAMEAKIKVCNHSVGVEFSVSFIRSN